MRRKLAYLHLPRQWSGRISVSTLILAITLAVAIVSPSGASAASQPQQITVKGAQVSVNAGTSLATVPGTALGINTAAWDSHLLDPTIPNLLQQDGVKVMRYPGGSTSDYYKWQSNTTLTCSICGGVNASDTFDAFMGVTQASKAQAMITVNYGSGSPQEAAGWVQYANKGGAGYNGPVPTYTGASTTGHNYGIKYWEIGNENYGNGTYGATWEYDVNTLGPTAYANGVVAYSQAMKAADPSVKIGLVLTAPGNWPDGVTSALSPQPWNDTVLPAACSSVDFVVAHWYAQGPTGESDAGLLGAPENGESTSVSFTPSISSMVSTLRSKINQYCGAHASAIQIMITETNSVSYNPGKQTVGLVNALFMADDYMNWLENGVASVDWWDLHNSIMPNDNNSPTLYGTANYGDYGVLSSGGTSTTANEPPANTPFPVYYGLQMLHRLVNPGDTIIAASSTQSLLSVFAVKRPNGSIALMIINKDPSVTYVVKLSWAGFTPTSGVTDYFYGQNSSSITTLHVPGLLPAFVQVALPYSLTTVVVSPQHGR